MEPKNLTEIEKAELLNIFNALKSEPWMYRLRQYFLYVDIAEHQFLEIERLVKDIKFGIRT